MYFDQVQLASVGGAARASQQVVGTGTLKWEVFPNPAKEFAVVRLEAGAASNAFVELMDNTGRKVYEQAVRVQKGLNQWTLHLPRLSAGVYYVRMVAGGTAGARTILIK